MRLGIFVSILVSSLLAVGCFSKRHSGRINGSTTAADVASTNGRAPGGDLDPGVDLDAQAPVVDVGSDLLSPPDTQPWCPTVSCPAIPCANPGWGKLAWSFQADAKIVASSAMLADGSVVVGSRNATLYRIRCGQPVWSWTYPCARGQGCPQAFEGPPLIGPDGTIYQGDDLLVPNFLFALKSDASVKWQFKTEAPYSQMDAPMVWTHDTLFVGSKGESGWEGPVGYLYAFDTAGKPLKGFPLDVGAVKKGMAGVGNIVVVPSERAAASELRGIDAHTNVFWLRKFPREHPDDHLTAVTLDGRGHALVALNRVNPSGESPSSTVHWISLSDGKTIHSVDVSATHVVGAILAGPKAQPYVVYLTADGRLHKLSGNEAGFKPAFSKKLGEEAQVTPAIGADGYIYAPVDKAIYRVKLDGSTVESLPLGATITAAPNFGKAGVLVVGTEDGRVIAVGTGTSGSDPNAVWPLYRQNPENQGALSGGVCQAQTWGRLIVTPYQGNGATTSQYKVVDKRWDAERSCSAVTLDDLSVDEKQLTVLCARFADKEEVPLKLGETVTVRIKSTLIGEGSDLTVAIWSGGLLRFFYHAGYLETSSNEDCGGQSPCISASFSGGICGPFTDGCGLVVLPYVTVVKSGCTGVTRTLAPGERSYVQQLTDDCATYPKGFFSVFGAMDRVTTECTDIPDRPLEFGYFDTSQVSQCQCQSHKDCRADHVCDTEKRRCVPNRCLTKTCGENTACNPYMGQCESILTSGAVVDCQSSADCGDGQVCYKPDDNSPGRCRVDNCPLSNCAAATCSGLVGCYKECLADCDCYNTLKGNRCDAGVCVWQE